jgi:hypothetical protein
LTFASTRPCFDLDSVTLILINDLIVKVKKGTDARVKVTA